jgi:predicted transcriptional regulator
MRESAKDKVYTFLFQSSRQYTITTIALKTKMPRSTVSKALLQLRAEGKVERELGPADLGNLWYA